MLAGLALLGVGAYLGNVFGLIFSATRRPQRHAAISG